MLNGYDSAYRIQVVGSDILDYLEVYVRNTLLNSRILWPFEDRHPNSLVIETVVQEQGIGHLVGGQSEMEPSYAHLSCACRISQLEFVLNTNVNDFNDRA
jgi:hypothetical protein